MTEPMTAALAVHLERYRAGAHHHHGQAQAHLTAQPPDFSAAATACHRALQYQRQAQALAALAVDAGLGEP